MIIALLAITQSPTAPALLKKVAAVYQSLGSYSELVEVNTTYTGTKWRQVFKTSFQRPGKWRFDYFEYQDNGTVNKCVLWSNGKKAQFWSDLSRDVTNAPTVGLGFGAMMMIAGDYVKLIPSLLDPKNVESSIVSGLGSLSLMPEAKVGGAPCYRIAGKEKDGPKLTLWVDKKSYLILRIVRYSARHGVTTDATFRPNANPKIVPATFNFVPPK